MCGYIYEYVFKKNMVIGRKLKSNFGGCFGFFRRFGYIYVLIKFI